LFQLFQKFGHIESIYLVKDKNTNVQKGTAFVTFQSTKSAQRALEAAGNSGFVTTTQRQDVLSDTNGLHLRKRRLFVNVAVDKKTAASLTVEKQGNKVTGKDRRNLYLKMEGRVANEADGNSSSNAWEHLPESDQLKRQRAFAEKNTKLRSPLFFINSNRLSVRNLAKHVDEADFKKLCVDATKRGLETHLVTQEDQVAHWRASGEMTTRDIMKRIEQAKEESGSVIPAFDEKNVKRFIPSVYIDRDFTTNKKEKAPSRGFGFVDFEHHVHALACLRELNNNPYYAAEFVSGGKKAVDAKRLARKRKGKGEAVKGDFVSEDGRILTPRLIVDFTVENKAKAKKQAEHRAQQQANIEKQRLEQKEKKVAQALSKKQQKKKSRGAAQRERKRRQREMGGATQDESVPTKETKKTQAPAAERETITKPKIKAIKPPKKKRKVDEEEQNFENLVDSYRKAFSGVSELKESEVKVQSLPKKRERRWFE
jgi:nucleolar protein 4